MRRIHSSIRALTTAVAVAYTLLAVATHGEGHKPVVALIHTFHDSEAKVTDLVSVALSKDKSIALVEREQVDRLINEQIVSAALAAPAVGARAEIGRLLQADVVVFLACREGEQPLYEVVGSESRTGIRRYQACAQNTGHLAADAETLRGMALRAVAATRQPVRAVCAIPPFVCADLGFDDSRWKGTYARLAEMELMTMPGIVVVEFQEAQALSEELLVAGRQTSVARPMPFYFLGEYRMDHRNPANPPFFRVILKQGATILDSKEFKGNVEEGGAAFIRRTVRDQATAHLGQSMHEEDPAKEMGILRDRARLLLKLGRFMETAELAEAFLLLNPGDGEMRKAAFLSYGRMATTLTVKDGIYTAEPARLRPSLQYSAIGIRHMEAYLTMLKPDDLPQSLSNLMRECGIPASDGVGRSGDQELLDRLRTLQTEYREMCLRVLEHRYRQLQLTPVFMNALFGACVYGTDTLEMSLAYRLRVARLVVGPESPFGDPLVQQYVQWILNDGISDPQKQGKKYSEFLKQLSELNHPVLLQLVAKEELALAPRPDAPRNPAGPHRAPQREKTQPVERNAARVLVEPLKSLDLPADLKILGLRKCGKSADVIWGFNGARRIYLMKEKDKAQEIFVADCRHELREPAFDGRYLWFPVSGPENEVLVIDPNVGVTARFCAQDGLPAFQHGVCAASQPGQACFVGATDRELRAYVATLSLGPDGTRSLAVVHEAVNVFTEDMAASDYRRDPQLGFCPKFAIMGAAAGSSRPLLLIGRSLADGWGLHSSLLVNTTTPSATVVKVAVDSHITADDVWHEGNEIYWIARGSIKRLGIDSLETEIVCKAPAEGRVLFYNGYWHVVGRRWWRADRLEGEYTALDAALPARHGDGVFFASAHYGLTMMPSPAATSLYQVSFVEAE
jgi:hypothetical protein